MMTGRPLIRKPDWPVSTGTCWYGMTCSTVHGTLIHGYPCQQGSHAETAGTDRKEEREKLYFHRRLLEGSLPLSIGGGIGQSRLCMLYLKKAHIGEIQASIWPEDMRQECSRLNMPLI